MNRDSLTPVAPSTRATADTFFLAVILGKLRHSERPLFACVDAAQLLHLGRRYHKIKVAECGRTITKQERKAVDTAFERAKELAAVYGLTIDVDGSGLGLTLTGDALHAFVGGCTYSLKG